MGTTLIEELSFSLGIPVISLKEFAGLTSRNKDFYRRTNIPKKNKKNEFRTIYLPSAEIKQIQHYITDVYLSRLPVHKSARAYVRGKNVLDNARSHRKNSHFLLLDIRHFFDSIDFELFKEMLMRKEIFSSKDDASIALLLCSRNKQFVQGCVSSPTIANAYLYEFDVAMEELARTLPSGVYTRYSDDIVFSSSKRIPNTIVSEVERKLAEFKLFINPKKTHFFSNLERVKITGIRIKKDRSLGLNTIFKKELKKEIYHFLKMAKSHRASETDKWHIQGKLAYLKMVDPSYYNTLQIKYSVDGLLLFEFVKKYSQ